MIVAVGYYLRYNLSYREVQELLYDRGINVCHTTIYRWVQEYSKVLYYLWKKKNRQSFYSWKMDETYIKIKGRWHYLYRAIDADGLTLDIWLRKKRDTQAAYAFLKRKKNRQSFYSWKMDETYIKIKGRWHYLYRAIDADGLTLDIWLRKKRDTQAAYAFLKRLHKQFGEPKAIVTDKAPSLGSAFRKLQSVGLYTKTEHRTVKYLNNLIEQDHRPIKRRNKFYQSLRTASSTIKGMETIRGIYKKNRRNGTLFGFSVSTEIKVLMGITA
ncbi:IS6 family transposase [Listeria monocytogenes]|nr:IS6 family transposase [Listeria monocytogenes]